MVLQQSKTVRSRSHCPPPQFQYNRLANNQIRSDLTMSDTSTDDQALSQELEILARRAGLEIPESRRSAMLKGFKDIKRMTALLRQPRTAANEPAGTYDIRTVTRSV
jgi:hypothetical protein